MASLDLRSINLGDKNILTFQTKGSAKSFKMPHLCFLMKATNRFWVFYVVARKSQNGEFHVMTKDGDFFSIPEIKWTGDTTYAIS